MTKKSKTSTANVPAPAPAPVETQAVATPDEETTTTLEPVQLTIADLQLLARIVDLASRRGAFQANELSQVGDAYNKLAGFLAYVEQSQKSEEEAKSAETTTAA